MNESRNTVTKLVSQPINKQCKINLTNTFVTIVPLYIPEGKSLL